MPRGDGLDAVRARAQDGDVRAFEELLAGQLPQVRRFARAFAVSEPDADDLAQEALIKAYKSLRLFRYQSVFSSWLYAIVRNTFLDAARSRAGRQRSLEDSLQPAHIEDLAGGPPPDEKLDREQEQRRLWRALRQVPLEFRAALVLFDIEGCTYDEVAAIEGVPVGTVKSRLSRGRTHLRRLLGEREAADPAAAPSPPVEEPGTSPIRTASNLPRRG